MKLTIRFARILKTLAFVAVLIVSAVPAHGELTLDGPRGRDGVRHRLVSETPGQVSNLSDLASGGGRTYLAWREELRDGRQEVRLRVAADGDNAFALAGASDVIATTAVRELIFSLRVAAFGTDVYVLFASGFTESLADVSLLRSSDGGRTFAQAKKIRGGDGASPYPDMAVDEQGVIHILLEDRGATDDVVYTTSSDMGVSFSEAVAVSPSSERSVRPRLAAGGESIAAVWDEIVPSARGEEEQSRVAFIRSIDGRRTFSPAIALSEAGKSAGWPSIAISGSIHVVWSERNTLMYRRSDDGGASFLPASVTGSTPDDARIREPRVAASDQLLRVAWIVEDEGGGFRGPMVRESRYGSDLRTEIDLSRDLPGAVFGRAALLPGRGLAAWSHTATGIATDSEVIVSDALGTCTVSWKAPVSGSWSTAANWIRPDGTSSVPGATDDVCIAQAGTYTVSVDVNASVGSLAVGAASGTPTLLIQASSTNHRTLTVAAGVTNSGRIVLNSATNLTATLAVTTGVVANAAAGVIYAQGGGGGTRYIPADVINDGTVTIEQDTVLTKHFVNRNLVTVAALRNVTFGAASAFTQEAGTLNIAGSFAMNNGVFNHTGGAVAGQPVVLINSSILNNGPGTARTGAFIFQLAGNTMTGDIAAGQTVTVQGTSSSHSTLTAATGFTNAGTIVLHSVTNLTATLTITTGVLTNTAGATIHCQGGGGGTRYITGGVRNEGTVTIEQDTVLTGHFVNAGAMTVAANRDVTFGAASTFTQEAGTLNVTGSFTMNNDIFNHNGGAITGQAVVLVNSSILNNGPGASRTGAFVFQQAGNTMTGDVAAGQTVMVQATSIHHAGLTAATGFTNAGTLALHSATNLTATLVVTAGVLTNAAGATIHCQSGGGGTRYITGDVKNDGTVTIEQDTVLTGHFHNAGAMSVSQFRNLTFGNASVFTQSGGTLSIAGSFAMNNDTFNHTGGAITGQPVVLVNASVLNSGGSPARAGVFVFQQGANSMTGDIAPGQTVMVQATSIHHAGLTAATGFTNAGTLALHSATNLTATLVVTAGVLTNAAGATIHCQSGGGGTRYITGDVKNDGTVTIEQDTVLTRHFHNAGVMSVAQFRNLTFGNASVFTQSGGTLNIVGSFAMNNDTFNHSGGSISGQPVVLVNASVLNSSGNALRAGTFVFQQAANSITGDIAPGQTVTVQATSIHHSTLTAATGFTNAGRVALESTTNLAATLLVTTGAMTNSATGVFHVRAGGGGTRTFTGSLINFGTVDVDISTAFNKAGAVYENRSVFDIAAGRTLTVTGAAATFVNAAPGAVVGGGNLTLGAGTIFRGTGNVAANIHNSGQFHPGLSPGILNITGYYTQVTGASLNIEIGGPAAGEYDRLNVSGTATLAGTLNVSLFGGYCPAGTFDFMTFAARSGDFVTKNGLIVGGGRVLQESFVAGTPIIYRLTTVGPVCNTAPNAVDDNFIANQGATLSVPAPGVLSNDSDDQGNSLTARFPTQPSQGSVVLQANGSFTYTPSPSFTGVDSFTYEAFDGQTASERATVFIEVIDGIAPVTAAAQSPEPNPNGWHDADFTVTLTANDGPGSGVREIRYQIDDGAVSIEPSASVNILRSEEGVFTLTYFAIDNAGNEEAPRSLTIRLDKTAPSLQAPPAVVAFTGAGANACQALVSDLGSPSVSDALSTPVVTIAGVPANNIFPRGVTALTYTATDAAGNSSSASQDVVVNDDTPPVITAPPNISVATGESAESCGVEISQLGLATATDNCGDPATTVSGIPAGNIFPVGTTVITYTATDPSGNSSAVTQEITVSDTTAPLITAPPAINVATGAGATSCSVIVSQLGTYSATDNCGTTDVTISGVPDGNAFPVGTTRITYTATDASGNTSSAFQDVIVTDTTPPALTAPATVRGSTGESATSCGLVITQLGAATASDNCNNANVTVTGIPAGDFFPVGTTVLTYTATDSAGNSTSATQEVIVTDDTPPVIAPLADITVSAGASCSAVVDAEAGVSATDNCGSAAVAVTLPAGNIFPVGTTVLTFVATDSSGNTSSETRRIIVTDDTAPLITAPADITVSAGASCNALVTDRGTPSVTDNCDGTAVVVDGLPAGDLYPLGTTIVTYTATDASGNMSSATQRITVSDTTAPVLTVPADINASTGPGATSCGLVIADIGTATASDNCGMATVNVSGVPAGNLFPVGTTIITYAADDGHGNTATLTQRVVVADSTPPVIAPLADITASAGASCNAVVNGLSDATATDNCGDANVTVTLPTGSLFGVGTHVLTYSATDASGNTSTLTRRVIVVDDTPPSIDAPPDITVPQDAGSSGAHVPNRGAASALDNCPGVVVTVTGVPAGNIFPVGTTIVTYTATDASGNARSATQRVTVESAGGDTTPPTITIITPAASGRYGLDRVISTSFTCADASGIAECTGAPFVDTSALGIRTFIVSARDNAGNTASRQVTYEVVNDAFMLVLDRDSLGRKNPPDEVTRRDFNLDKGRVGLREQIPYFAEHTGGLITLDSGLKKDEGWFALKTPPQSWAAAGPTTNGTVNYMKAGPGLGGDVRKGDREELLKSVPDVTPLQLAGLNLLVGQRVYAVVMDGKVKIKYDPLIADLKGKNLGVVAFEVIAVTTGGGADSLPAVQVKILDAVRFGEGLSSLLLSAPAP